MTDKAKIKKELTIVLRALLLSAPLGLTAVEIERDYRDAQGYDVPYRQLGYNNTTELIDDMPDVAMCSWERGHAVFHGVADKTTKHIKSLVSRQNVDVKKCLKRRNAIERQVSNRGRSQPYTRSSTSSVWSKGQAGSGPGNGPWRRTSSYPPAGGSGQPSSKTVSVQSSSPAYLRTQLKSLLTTHPNGILNTHFDSIYSRKFGFQIDYAALGFKGLPDLVKSLKSDISVEHIGEDKFRIYSNENFPKGAGAGSGSRSNAEQKPRVIPRYIPNAPKPVPFQSSPQKSPKKASTVPLNAATGRAKRPPIIRPSQTSSATAASRPSESTKSPREPSPTGSELIDKQLCSEIQQVLGQHPEGIFAANLPSEYKAITGKELPLISIGFYSVVELVSAIPETVAIERQKKNSDWRLFDARTYMPSAAPEPVGVRRDDASLSSDSADDSRLEEEKRRIRDVLLAHPTGVLLQDLPACYEKYFKKPLPCQEFGVNDVNSLVLAIPDTIKVVYKGKKKVFLHAQDQRAGLTYSAITKTIPQDAIGYGYSYHPVKRPNLNEYFPVYVSTVYTPHKLSIQLKEAECNVALEHLMDQLESVYHYPEGEKYLMPDAMIAINQICCALYHEDNNWHRGLITGVPNIDLVEVLYVDYGTMISVPKSSLRLLKSCFMKLPMQAIDARLAGIEPSGEKWSNESRDVLLSLSYDKPLLAYAVENKHSVLSLLLCDTSTEEDVHINDLLVSKGLARFVEDIGMTNEPSLENSVEPQDAELSLQMLTGIGLPVPEDDSASAFRWLDEEQEVQQIMATAAAGDGQARGPSPGEGLVPGSEVTGEGDGSKRQDQGESSGDSGPPPLEEGEGELDQELVAEMARELSEVEAGDEGEGAQRVPWKVSAIDLVNGQTLHLVSFGGCGQYVTSVEIVHLIWSKDTDENALFDMIERKAAQLGQIVVEEIEHEELATSLAREGVPLSPTQPSRLQLFTVASMAALVHVSGQARPELVQQLKTLADEIPALEDDEFSRESLSSETSSSADIDVDLNELTKMHDVLRIRRERILKDLMTNTGVGNVDDLTHIERLMKEIEEKIERGKASRTVTSSVDDMSAQLGQASLGSSMSLPPTSADSSSLSLPPATPDDVFSSPRAAFPDALLPPVLTAQGGHLQTAGSAQARHVSDRTGMGPKQTAMITPLQRHSTGTAPAAQRMGVQGGVHPVGLGRGQPFAGEMANSACMHLSSGASLGSLNPNVPEFVPSPKRDGSDGSDFTAPGNVFKPPPPLVGNIFARPPPPLPFQAGVPAMGRGRPSGLVPALPPDNVHVTRLPEMPPMQHPNLRAGNAPFMTPFPPAGSLNSAPGLAPLPPDFALVAPPRLFDPTVPPPQPHLFGLGRGSQKWSVND